MSMPTWSKSFGYSTTSVFFVEGIPSIARLDDAIGVRLPALLGKAGDSHSCAGCFEMLCDAASELTEEINEYARGNHAILFRCQ